MIKKYKRFREPNYPAECEAVLCTGKNDKEIENFTGGLVFIVGHEHRRVKMLALGVSKSIMLRINFYICKPTDSAIEKIFSMPPEEFELMYESDLDK